MDAAASHPFVRAPHRTLWALALPVLVSLIAEPLTGAVDTAFVARLGAVPLAGLGVGAILLSSSFWIFNFLGIATQTEIARTLGSGDDERARDAARVALGLGLVFGLGVTALLWLLRTPLLAAMGADREVSGAAAVYLSVRLVGAPAVLMTGAAFGALRGLQDMRTPLRIAVLVNVLNVGLDGLLIFGLGPIPAFGIAGAAAASSLSQWVGAGLALWAVRSRLGAVVGLDLRGARRFLVVGGDLFLRTALLSAFLVLTTRAATALGAEAGAGHQAIRQVWMLCALILDAYAAAAQSLIGYFLGAGSIALARRVAAVASGWSLATGVVLAALLIGGESLVVAALVPTAAVATFHSAWWAAALAQPLNALSFITDGIHWGTSDYRYLRNAMAVSTTSGIVALGLLDHSLTGIWLATAAWIIVRSALGVGRIWPGTNRAPLGRAAVGGSDRAT